MKNNKEPNVETRKKVKLGRYRQCATSLVITISFLILGTSLAWPSPVLYTIRATGKPINMTSNEEATMVTMYYVGNILMPIPSGVIMDRFGRRNCLLPFSILPFASWILTYFAKDSTTICIARLLSGLWGGLVTSAVPLYIGEIAEPIIRGALSTLAQTLVNFGVVFVLAIGPLVSYKMLAVACGIFPVIFFFSTIFIPESPFWLIYKGRDDKAARNLAWLRGAKRKEDVEDEIDNLILAVHADIMRPTGWSTLIKSKGLRKSLLIVEMMAISQRMSGITSLMAYMSITLPDKKIGLLNSSGCVLIVGVVWCVSVITIMPMVDRFGRVPLLLISSAGCSISMLSAAIWFTYSEATRQKDFLHWIPFASFFVHGWFFNMGLGPLATTIQGEMFPSNLKAIASAITSMVLALTSAAVNSVYLIIAETVGMSVNFYMYSFWSLLCFIFVFIYVVETKGKTLLEIQQELHSDST